MSITPPSPRMIIRGTLMPALRTLLSVLSAVFIILGRMLPLMAAVRVRRVRPYSLLMSDATEASMPFSWAASRTRSSSFRSSTPNALLPAITVAPWALSSSMALPRLSLFTSFTFM